MVKIGPDLLVCYLVYVITTCEDLLLFFLNFFPAHYWLNQRFGITLLIYAGPNFVVQNAVTLFSTVDAGYVAFIRTRV
jgi:hypothetical protein